MSDELTPEQERLVEMLNENTLRSLDVLTGVIRDLGIGGIDAQALYAALLAQAHVIEKRLKQELDPATFANLTSFADGVAAAWATKFADSVHMIRIGPEE